MNAGSRHVRQLHPAAACQHGMCCQQQSVCLAPSDLSGSWCPQRDVLTIGQHGSPGTHAVKVELPCPAAIRPAASRLPEWAMAHVAVPPEPVTAPRIALPLWQSPPAAAAAGMAHAAASVAVSQPHWPAADPRGPMWPASLPAVHREPPPHPTVMLFGTNLRLVAAKGPALEVAAQPAATVLQSLEEKIKELNEVRCIHDSRALPSG